MTITTAHENDHRQVAQRFVTLFQRLQRVPEGLVRGYDRHRIENMLHIIEGIHLGMGLTAHDALVHCYQETYEAVQEDRGWNCRGDLPLPLQMRRYGYTDDRIIAEMVTLELETWQRLAQRAS